MEQCSPHLHSSSVGLLLWGLFSTKVQGMAANVGGVLFSACSVLTTVGASVGGDWPRCSWIKQVCESWHSIRPWGIFPVLWGCSFRLLSFLGSVTAGGIRTFFLLGLFCAIGIPSNVLHTRLYAVTGIDMAVMAVDFATGIWFVTVVLTAV